MNCPICGNPNSRELAYGGYCYKGRDYPLMHCAGCSLDFVTHRLSDEEIGQLYQEEKYFDAEYAGGATQSYGENRIAQYAKADKALAVISRFVPKGKILDVGCAGGYFVQRAGQLDYRAYGVELSERMTKFAQEQGLAVCQGTIFDVPKEWGRFDVIYLGDVLEHAKDPHPIVAEISSRLRPGGVIAIEVPLTYNLTLSGLVIGFSHLLRGHVGYKYFLPAQHRTKLMPKAPYHLLMFGPRSIRALLEGHGFRILYLRVYEGEPKHKFYSMPYRLIRWLGHYVSSIIPQRWFGDRMMVIAEKVDHVHLSAR